MSSWRVVVADDHELIRTGVHTVLEQQALDDSSAHHIRQPMGHPMEPSALHVLIIDDSPEDRLTFRRFLTRHSPDTYTITEADRGDRALAAFPTARPDCVLLDYRLPDTDGLAVLAALRAQSDVPVVLLTGVGSEALAVEALQRGAQDYLVKGALTPERLALTIQHAVGTVRLARERDQTLALLTTVLDTLPVGVAVLDTDGCVRQGNPALARILDQPAAALPGQALSQLWPDLAAPCAEVLRGTPFRDLELHLPTAAGHAERWLALSGTSLRDPDGDSLLTLLTVQDTTARRQAATARRASEARFRALIELGTEGLALLEPDGQLRYGSPGLTALLGYPQEIVPTLALGVLCHPDDQPQFAAFLAALSAHPGAAAQVTTRLRHQDGSWRWIAQQGCNQSDFPPLAALVLSFHDVTERVRAEEAAQAAQQTAAEALFPDQLEATEPRRGGGGGAPRRDLRCTQPGGLPADTIGPQTLPLHIAAVAEAITLPVATSSQWVAVSMLHACNTACYRRVTSSARNCRGIVVPPRSRSVVLSIAARSPRSRLD